MLIGATVSDDSRSMALKVYRQQTITCLMQGDNLTTYRRVKRSHSASVSSLQINYQGSRWNFRHLSGAGRKYSSDDRRSGKYMFASR